MKKKIWMLLPLAAALLAGCGRDTGMSDVEQGMQAIEDMDYDTAIQEFESSVKAGKDETAAYRGMGIAYMGLFEYDNAVEAFDKALSLTDEKMPETRRDIQYYKASALYKSENYDDTIAVCTALIADKPEGTAYYLRGACYLKKDENEQAKLDFDKAVELSPSDYDLYLNIYECYREKNLTADGDPYLREALAVSDSSREVSYQKARIYFYLEDYTNARSLLEGLVEDKDPEAMDLMGKVYLALEDTAHARKMYQDCIAASGETPANYNGLVLCDLMDGNYSSAIENIEKGLSLEGEEGRQELMYNAIVAFEYQGDFETAKEKAREYVETYPSDERGQREYTFLESR